LPAVAERTCRPQHPGGRGKNLARRARATRRQEVTEGFEVAIGGEQRGRRPGARRAVVAAGLIGRPLRGALGLHIVTESRTIRGPFRAVAPPVRAHEHRLSVAADEGRVAWLLPL